MELSISRRTKLFPALKPRRRLKSAITALLRLEAIDDAVEISVVLCDDDFIRDLNRDHRGIDKATDVLSFPQFHPGDDFAAGPHFPGAPRTLGDVVISLETADAQARGAGWRLEDEVDLLAVHGVLHLLGLDDETFEGAAEMREKSARVLSEAGITLPKGATHPYFIEHLPSCVEP